MIMRRLLRLMGLGILVAGALGLNALGASSQDATDNQGNQNNQANPAKQRQAVPWSSTCSSAARGQPLECALEQRAFVRQSGQLVGMVTIKVPGDTKK